MAVRNDFTAGEVLAAADLNDTFASKPPFAYGTATPSTTVEGFIWYDENDTPPAPKFWDGAAFQALGGGKVLQVVRATDTTQRTTSSGTFVDVTGVSVTISPQKSDSIVLLIATFYCQTVANSAGSFQITDSSNNAISGAEGASINLNGTHPPTQQIVTMIGYATPATTSATTYKLRFSNSSMVNTIIYGQITTTQLFAIEVSA
jgi:hypothetical protein